MTNTSSRPLSGLSHRSELRMAGVPRVGDDVPNVLHARGQHDEALEAEAEAAVRHGPELAKIAVPPVVLHIEAHLADAPVEHIQALLALGAADDFADGGGKHVHRCNGFLVIVEAHVEGLDVLRVVVNYGWLLVDLLA